MHSVLLIAVISLVTVILRFLPFAIFRDPNKVPKFVTYLGNVLPYAIMVMLVVYCLRNTSVFAYPNGIPELISVLLVVILHVWKRNTLISIISGTVCYMLLVQLIF